MTFKIKIETKWEPVLKISEQKRIMRKAGMKMALRLRKRFRMRREERSVLVTSKTGEQERKNKSVRPFTVTGQLGRSIAFKLRRDRYGVVGLLWPKGVRKDADTHKSRAPMKNYSIAAFHAAAGRDPIQFMESDQPVFSGFLQVELERVLARREKT